MSETAQNLEKLIDEISAFIEKEREMYGDFSMDFESQPEPPEKANQDSSPTLDSDDDFQSPKQNDRSMANSTPDSFDPQEGFFNQDDSNKVYYEINKCDTLEELEALCQKADVLRTDLDDTQVVFGVGNPNADLMLIGEAPGAEEDKQGEPFVGRAGQLLNDILAAINFERGDVYIGNILKHRPPNNRNPKPEERKRSLPFLLRQIDLIEPKLILALGKVAAQTLLDKKNSLTSMREEFHDFRGKYQLLATYHPAALLRHKKWKRPTWEDVQMLRERYDELDGTP